MGETGAPAQNGARIMPAARKAPPPNRIAWRGHIAMASPDEKKTPAWAGVSRAIMRIALRVAADQNVMLHVSMRPTSPAASSLTRSFQVPLSVSLDRFRVKVPATLSALPPLRLWML